MLTEVTKMSRFIWIVSVALLLSAPALARDSSAELRTRLEAANAELSQLEVHEHADTAAVEFGQARLEVAEIQGKLAAQDYGWATIVLNRLEARLELITSALDRATYEALADQRETDLYEIQTEADERQLEFEAQQALRQQLQDEVAIIVDRMNSEQ